MNETTPEKVKVGSKGKKGCYSSFLSFLLVLLIPVLLLGGYWAQRAGFEKIRQMRQLERIPHVEAVALIEGEVTMTGHALDGGEMVDGRWQMTGARWQMTDDGWPTAYGRWQMTACR